MKYEIDKKWKIQRTNPKLIISFSLYGNKAIYTEGAIQNVLLSHKIYPNWTCRFYVDESVPKKITDELLNLGAQVYVVKKNKYTTDRQRSLWRFLALGEKCRVIFRDTDSRINSREQEAVLAWCKSGKTYSRLWDNTDVDEGHFNPIMAGMWGAVSNTEMIKEPELPLNLRAPDYGLWSEKCKPLYPNIEKMILNWKIQGYRSDEMFLIKYVIPKFKGLANCHIMGCGIDPAPLLYIKLEGTKYLKYKYNVSNPEDKKYVPVFSNLKITKQDFKGLLFSRKIKGGKVGAPIFPESKAFVRNNLEKYFVDFSNDNSNKICDW